MTEGQEVLASHEEVEAFVGKLRDFHGSLGEGERAMLGTILEGSMAQSYKGTKCCLPLHGPHGGGITPTLLHDRQRLARGGFTGRTGVAQTPPTVCRRAFGNRVDTAGPP